MKQKYDVEELKNILYEEKNKKPLFTNIILSIMLVFAFIFSAFLIIDSTNRIDETYEIINAILILLIILNFTISFKKNRKQKSGNTIFTSILIIITIIFNVLYLSNIISLPVQKYLPDFYNKSLTYVLTWTKSNNIKHEETFDYSDNIKKYNIINQTKTPKTLLKNLKEIGFTISKGPDYTKEIIIPDMTNWNSEDALKFINKNHLNNVQFIFEENKEIENNIIIRQSITGKIKRNDKLVVTTSLGDKSKLTPINLKDLKNENLLNSEVYLGKHGITYELKYEFSNKIERGKIIKTDPQKNSKISPNDKIILTISKGKEIKVPELKNMTYEDVTKWAIENNLEIEYSDKYDNEIKKGLIISSNCKAGDIIEEETKISVTFSKGKLVMPKFSELNSFITWATTYNIKYEIKEEFNDEIAIDNIIKFSVNENDTVNQENPIIVYISKGKAIKVPNFIGKTKTEIQKECNSLGITCTFTNTRSEMKENTAIKQSITEGTEISKKQTINIEIATAKQNAQAKNNQTNQNSQTNTNSNQNNCETVVIRLNGSEIKANDPAGTCSTLKSKYGNAIKCEYTSSDNGTDGFILNSREINGKSASTCNPLIVKIVKNS